MIGLDLYRQAVVKAQGPDRNEMTFGFQSRLQENQGPQGAIQLIENSDACDICEILMN